MKFSKYIIPAFIVLALVQLFVPAKMIMDREDVLSNGIPFKFQTAPVDPNDIFRGKYIMLSFKENSYVVDSSSSWDGVQAVYVTVANDEQGFAKLTGIYKTLPKNSSNYFKANVAYISTDSITKVFVKFPFDRFYMEESKAPEAEEVYREAQRDTTQQTYAVVFIKDGESGLKDVMINNIPVKEMIRRNHAKNP